MVRRMKQLWQAPTLRSVGSLAQLVEATSKISGTQDSATGDSGAFTHKNKNQ
jgi:hypothetical protein